MSQHDRAGDPRTPIQWAGVFFALLCTLLLVTGVDLILSNQHLDMGLALVLRLLAPVLAGLLTAFYVGTRAGIHAFIGGMISIPLLALFIFPSNWQSAVLAGALCALAGALGEVMLRRR